VYLAAIHAHALNMEAAVLLNQLCRILRLWPLVGRIKTSRERTGYRVVGATVQQTDEGVEVKIERQCTDSCAFPPVNPPRGRVENPISSTQAFTRPCFTMLASLYLFRVMIAQLQMAKIRRL
jgi:hypothetical protein